MTDVAFDLREALQGLSAAFQARGLAADNAALTAQAMMDAHPNAVPATRVTYLFGRAYRWWRYPDGQLRLEHEVVPIFPDQQ